MKWADLVFPPINLWSYPNMINEESNVKPVWKPKEVPADTINNLSHYSHEPKKLPADAMQVGGDHYKKMGIQPWELMEVALSKEEFIGYLKGCVIKYAMRDGKKENAPDDADKARHYMAKLAEVKRGV